MNFDLFTLLREAHDKMDDFNASANRKVDEPSCHWCGAKGLDSNGLKHTEGCILIRLRKAVG